MVRQLSLTLSAEKLPPPPPPSLRARRRYNQTEMQIPPIGVHRVKPEQQQPRVIGARANGSAISDKGVWGCRSKALPRSKNGVQQAVEKQSVFGV